MRVDVIDVGAAATSFLERAARGAHGTVAARRRQGDVRGVGACAVANDLGERRCATRQGKVESLEQQHAGTFGHHESVTRSVEGARRCGGVATVRR